MLDRYIPLRFSTLSEGVYEGEDRNTRYHQQCPICRSDHRSIRLTYGLQVVSGTLTEMNEKNYPAISLLINIDRDLQQALVAERSMLGAATQADIDALDAVRIENIGQAIDRFNQYKALALSKGEQEAIKDFEASIKEWQAYSDQVVALLKEGTAEAAAAARVLSTGIGNRSSNEGIVDEIRNRGKHPGTHENPS